MEIPEHLRARAQAARIKAGIEQGLPGPIPEGTIPEHLLERSRQRRARLGNSQADNGGVPVIDSSLPAHLQGIGRKSSYREHTGLDPFASQRQFAQDAAARLTIAKANIVLALQPIRDELTDTESNLKGQLLLAKNLNGYASFSPNKYFPNTEAFFTIYDSKETFIDVDDGKSIRIGEQRAWRMPVAAKEIGNLLKSAGQGRIRGLYKLMSNQSILVEEQDIDYELASEVLESAASVRRTNSVTLFEGEPNKDSYDLSYGKRYSAVASIVRNPADTPEDQAVFGVSLKSLTAEFSTDEGYANDGGYYDSERILFSRFSLGDRKSSEDALANSLTAAGFVLGAFTRLVEEPNKTNVAHTFRAMDSVLK